MDHRPFKPAARVRIPLGAPDTGLTRVSGVGKVRVPEWGRALRPHYPKPSRYLIGGFQPFGADASLMSNVASDSLVKTNSSVV